MKAYTSGGHYHLHIDEKHEFPSLFSKSLETTLQCDFSGFNLGKKIVLRYNHEASDPTVDFIPTESSWDELKEIHITLTRNQYELLGFRKIETYRFGGGSSIDLHLEKDLSDFI